QTVLGIEREISVAGTILVLDVAVIVAALVGIAEQDRDGSAVRHALENAGPDFRRVLFLTLGDEFRLPRPAAAQVGQQILHAQRQPRRATVDDDSIAGAMTDAARRDAKQVSKSIACHAFILSFAIRDSRPCRPRSKAKRREHHELPARSVSKGFPCWRCGLAKTPLLALRAGKRSRNETGRILGFAPHTF